MVCPIELVLYEWEFFKSEYLYGLGAVFCLLNNVYGRT